MNDRTRDPNLIVWMLAFGRLLPHVANAGVFSASNGHWWLRATNGYTDGTYIFQPPDIWIATGRLGTGAWRQRSGSTASILWVMGVLIVLFVVWKVSGLRKVAAVAKAPSVS
jgi:hypothetical protein